MGDVGGGGGGIMVQECTECRSRLFPDRLRCPACGGREFRRVRVTTVRVEEVTVRPGAEWAIATVRGNGAVLGNGAVMIARVPVTARASDDLRLTDDPRDTEAALVPTTRR